MPIQSLSYYVRLAKRIYKSHIGSFARQLGIASDLLEGFVSAALSSTFSNLIFLPLFSMAIFVVYMAHYHFFSYDFFVEGVFGMRLFALTAVLIISTISVTLFGSGMLLYAKLKGFKIPPFLFYLSGVVNLLFLTIVITALFIPERRAYILFILIVTLYLAVHFSVFFFARPKLKISLLLSLFIITLLLLGLFSDYTAELLGSALRIFGAGGEIPIQLINNENDVVNARLVLLTPKKVIFLEENSNLLVLEELDKVVKLRYLTQP